MPQTTTTKNPISRTAYYTLGVRAWDASLPKPVCNDTYATMFMNDEAREVWNQFKDLRRQNSSNASRHAIIDHSLQEALHAEPSSLVVIIGAGFDTRAFRLKGGKWVEVDDNQIIAAKESILPALTSSNQLTRIPIDFRKESLVDKLDSFASKSTVHIIVEGVLMYLSEDARQTLVQSLKKLFPNNVIYCDLMRRSFFERYGKEVHEKIIALGATFTDMKEHPEQLFARNGYQMISCTSIPLYAAQHMDVGIPAFMVKYFLQTLRRGYEICIFRITEGH